MILFHPIYDHLINFIQLFYINKFAVVLYLSSTLFIQTIVTSPFSSDITINSYSKISGLLSVVDDYSWCHQQILTCLFRRDRHLDKQQLNTKCEAYIKVRKCLEIDPDIRYQCDKNTINNLKTIFNENYPQCQKSYTQALSHSSQRTKPYLNLIYIIVAVVVSISFSY